jgi:tetratricopeptide (TPR) repeat protein
MTKKIILIWVLLFFAGLCYGQSNFTKGEELLMKNQPAQAENFLIRAISDDPANPVAYIYLGIVYEQIGRVEDAISIYRRILPSAGNFSANVANNLGNVYFQKGNIDTAEQYYTQAISFDAVYPNAYLGRANTRIKTGNLKNAISDYEQYLKLDPSSAQRAKIEQLVNLIKTEAAAAEMKRLMAEEEARRLAEERQRLLDSVSASLQSVVDSSKGISSGTESVENYDGEFELE